MLALPELKRRLGAVEKERSKALRFRLGLWLREAAKPPEMRREEGDDGGEPNVVL